MHVPGATAARDEGARGVCKWGERGGTGGGLRWGEGRGFVGAVVACSAAAGVDVSCLRNGGVRFCDVEGHCCWVYCDVVCTYNKFQPLVKSALGQKEE